MKNSIFMRFLKNKNPLPKKSRFRMTSVKILRLTCLITSQISHDADLSYNISNHAIFVGCVFSSLLTNDTFHKEIL